MSNTKHISGPWIVQHVEDTLFIGPPAVDGHSLKDVVTSVSYDEGYKENVKERQLANAKLIAAAPELLEALQNLNEEIVKTIPIGRDSKLRGLFTRSQDAFAAIKKATE